MESDITKTIERLDAYLNLVRYKYTTLEQLKRLQILNDYYKTKEELSNKEKIKSDIHFVEQLSDSFILPLKVHGVFLSVGRPKQKYYSEEELRKAVENPVNKSFPLMVDHRDNEAGKIIGKVDYIVFNEKEKVLEWYGHINDETQARNILDGIITQVSATIYSTSEYDNEYGLCGKDLVIKELSLVMNGAEPKNSILVG